MNHYARVVGGVAVEVWNDGGLNSSRWTCIAPALAKQFKPCLSHVLPGAVIINGEWVNPEPIVIEQADNDGEI